MLFTQAKQRIVEPRQQVLVNLRIDLENEFSRLCSRIDHGHELRNVEFVNVTLSNSDDFKKSRNDDGTHTGRKLQYGVILLDGFLAVFNENTRKHDGKHFSDHADRLAASSQPLDFKIDHMRVAVSFVQKL
ncbi:MAG TPA: hypothetical protein VIM37_03695 [Candidatus Microsaccharimonas sp.]|jgi:hypothetical protein